MFGEYKLVEGLMIDGTKKGYDILFEELKFMEYGDKANKYLQEWGKMLGYYWKAVMGNEGVLVKAVK